MKIQNKHSSPGGFTLVELLVVIMIIAILSSLGFAVASSAMQKARMVTSQSSATNVANAVEAFYSEYHLLPDPAGATEDNIAYSTTDSNGVALLDILAGYEEDPDEMQNERKVKFLGVKEAEKANRDGIVYNSDGDKVVGLYDSWGQPFFVVLDYDYDGRLEFTPSNAYTYDAKLNNKRVAVYSLGTDSPSDAKRKHLVKTW